ncbi:hypothetical protein FKP32DRAFT_17451 [Trametes sanguinea]|nr:hypothetical protein FKP32DRAFT_17451 [Trametes sanguinea]
MLGISLWPTSAHSPAARTRTLPFLLPYMQILELLEFRTSSPPPHTVYALSVSRRCVLEYSQGSRRAWRDVAGHCNSAAAWTRHMCRAVPVTRTTQSVLLTYHSPRPKRTPRSSCVVPALNKRHALAASTCTTPRTPYLPHPTPAAMTPADIEARACSDSASYTSMPGDIPMTPSMSPVLSPTPTLVPGRPRHRPSALRLVSWRILIETATILCLTIWFTTLIVIASGLFSVIGLHLFRLANQSPNVHILSGPGWVAILIGSTILGAALGILGQVVFLVLNHGKPYTFGDGHTSAVIGLPVAYLVSGFAPSLGVAVWPRTLAAVGLASAEALKIGGTGMGFSTAILVTVYCMGTVHGFVCIT